MVWDGRGRRVSGRSPSEGRPRLEEGGYRVGGRDLVNNSPDTLATALARATNGNRAQPITIRADARAVHQAVVTAMDVAGRLGYRQINIATVHDGSESR